MDNVRQSEDEVAKKEYLLSTGQLDNPVYFSLKSDWSSAIFTTRTPPTASYPALQVFIDQLAQFCAFGMGRKNVPERFAGVFR